MSRQLLNHFKTTLKKSKKTTFLAPKMVKMALSEGQNLTLNFDFRARISTFRAENAPKIGHYKAKNNAQTTSEQLQNTFQKV